jgi:hypothetical protein
MKLFGNNIIGSLGLTLTKSAQAQEPDQPIQAPTQPVADGVEYPFVFFQKASGKFISLDESGVVGNELNDKPEQGTIFCDGMTWWKDIIDDLREEFGEIGQAHLNIQVTIK